VEERAGEAFVRGLTGTLKQRVREDFMENLDAALQLARNLEAVSISRLEKAVAPVAPTASGPRPGGGAAWTPRSPGPRPRPKGHNPAAGRPRGQGHAQKKTWYAGIVGTKRSAGRRRLPTPRPRPDHQKTIGSREVTGPRSPCSVPQWTPTD
jgi:hypothetical protein